MQRHHRHLLSARRKARGVTLIDALIALAILAFGMLGMTRLQTRMLAQTTEAQSRLLAVQFGDELLSSALIDAANHNCYTLPATGTCGSTAARNYTDALKTTIEATPQLPSAAVTSTYTAASGQLTVRITWTGKESGETRVQEGTTDVRQ
jgi:type IV pilus assembly protein PilV